jgi:hypothetical protein
VAKGCRRALAVIITDSQIHDPDDVLAYSAQVAREILAGRLPRMNFVFVGVGSQIDEAQMERISHAEYPGLGHLWCHRIADRMEEMADLVAVLVDATMTVAAGGTITDEQGRVLRSYEGRLPAVLEFDVPPLCDAFVLEVGGQRYRQPIPGDEDDDHDDDHDDAAGLRTAPAPATAPRAGRRHGGHGHRHGR